ncbi:MAG: hypothetical protein IIY91_02320 [Selenomonas sp.]|nr:hypothetical protein [Selenomonas sp.]
MQEFDFKEPIDMLEFMLGVQFYTGNWLDSTLTTKTGQKVSRQSAFCLETQFFPDSPNKKDFPDAPALTFQSATACPTYCEPPV